MTLLIKQATVIETHSSHNRKTVNIFIENGIIKKIGTESPKADQVIDAKDAFVSIGWFDMRASLCDPGLEHKETLVSGAAAAMSGGFTGIACLPDTYPVIQTKDTLSYIKSSTQNLLVDIYPIAAVTHDLKGEELSEMLELHHNGAIAFADGNNPIWHAGVLVRALQYTQPFNGLIIQHAEEKKLTQYGQMNEGITSTYLGLKGIPAIAEELMISRDLDLLQYATGKIHFSRISTKGSVDLIRQAKKKGLKVTCDVAVPNLIFDDEVLKDFDTNFKVNPPLRTKEDIKALWKGIEDGTIDVIVTDHCPQDEESKHLEFDQAEFGMAGFETAFAALLGSKPDKISTAVIIEKISTNPRKILGLPDLKIAEGEAANLTIFSETTDWTFEQSAMKSKSKNSPFIGKNLKGRALAVVNKDKVFIQ
jgi:dihydroorotase